MMGEPIDINKASVEVLGALKGVGRSKAEAIISTRESLGLFDTVEDLLQVPGIGKSLLEQNRGILLCSAQNSALYTPHQNPVRRSLRRTQGISPARMAVKPKEEGREIAINHEINKLHIIDGVRSDRAECSVNNESLAESSSNNDACFLNDLDIADDQNSFSDITNEEDDDDDDVNIDTNDEQYSDMLKLDFNAEMNSTEHSESVDRVNINNFISVDVKDNGSDSQITHKSYGPQRREDNQLCSCSLGSDTPHQEASFDLPDVPLSPMRITDGDELEYEERDDRENEHINEGEEDINQPQLDGQMMTVDDVSTLVPDKKQNKRKSEVCLDSKGICPVKKSCKAIDTSDSSDRTKPSHSAHKFTPPVGLKPWLIKYEGWTPAQKLIALDSLIDICDLGQVRHIHQIILPQFQRDFISLLPKELALYVLSFLEPKDLLRAAQTCKYWNALAADNLLWKEKYREAGLDEQILCNQSWKKSSSVNHMSPYKAAFMRQHKIEMNWRINPLTPPLVLKGHDDHVITCLQFSENTVVSGSDDNTLKVWDPNSEKCLRTLTGHTGGVWSSQMYGNLIVSGSTDRMLRVWNAETGECIHTLYGHTSTVRCLHLHGNIVVSGSRDATLRVWDVTTGVCEHVLVGHVAAVRCVQYNGKLVVSGAYDFMVKVWNPEREECIHTLQGHTNRVYSLQFDGVHVVSGSLDTSIRVWDVETGQCKYTLMGHQSLTSKMELKNNILISGNADSTVKVWDIITGQCLQTLSGAHKHRSAVTCLQFNNKFVVTSSDDGTVKLWDVKTGQFIRNLVTLESGGSGGVVWRIRASETKLICAVGSRNGTEETKLLVLDFDVGASENAGNGSCSDVVDVSPCKRD